MKVRSTTPSLHTSVPSRFRAGDRSAWRWGLCRTSYFLLPTVYACLVKWRKDADHFETVQARKHPQSTNLSLVKLGSMILLFMRVLLKGRINCISFLNRTGTIMQALTFDQCVHIWVHIICSVLLNSAQRRFILCILWIFPLLKITFHLICSNWIWSIVSLIERDSLVCAQFYNVETSTILITFFEARVTPQTYITKSRNLAKTSRRQPEKPVVLQVD